MSRFLKLVLVFIFPTLLIGITSATMMANPDDGIIRIPVTEVAGNDDENLRVNGSPIVIDGGFEGGSPNANWEEYATTPISVICNKSCSIDDTNYAHTGENWAWFGGFPLFISTITQTVTIPVSDTAELEFYLRYNTRGAGGVGNDYFRVLMDGNQLFEVVDTEINHTTYITYTKVTVDISAYADGQPHALMFDSYIGNGEGVDDFMLDDVAINLNATPSGATDVYLPTIFNNYCVPPSYAETVRYNMSIINAPAMWAFDGVCALGEGLTVAVIDTGVDLDHPDLQANIVGGRTYVAGTSTPDDDEGHGTHVAGAVAAVMNDSGVLGVAPRASIMPIKVLDFEGSGFVSDVAAGIRWAADNGANVINLSLGGISETDTERDAVDYATSKGVLVIAAAGNCGNPFTFPANGCNVVDQTSYPAGFTNAMAVASTTSGDTQSSFSTQGSYVEIAAPGSGIYSTIPGGGYASGSGTSQASPHVAGLAAAIWSLNPSLTNAQIRTILNDTAVDLGTEGKDIQFGNGRINAEAAATQSANASGAIVPFAVNSVTPQAAEPNIHAPHAPGQIIVKMNESASIQSIETLNALFVTMTSSDDVSMAENKDLDVYILTVPESEELAYLDSLSGMAGVEYAEFNYIVTVK